MLYQCDTPIALFVFNRPKLTEKIFERIRDAKPKKLLLIADGPRKHKVNESEKCELAREIVSHVDWKCEIIKNFSEINLGCKKRLSSGIDWVFTQVEEAIILEDDCLPELDFFRFCDVMLHKYRHDSRVMSITGTNTLIDWKSSKRSYHFSRYTSIWGWATWKRAWNLYDVEINLWNEDENKLSIKNVLKNPQVFRKWEKSFNSITTGSVDTWDWQWQFALFMNSGLTIVPSKNLVSNIGFGIDATHTVNEDSITSNLETKSMQFPLISPTSVVPDIEYESKIYKIMFGKPSIQTIIKRKLKPLLRNLDKF